MARLRWHGHRDEAGEAAGTRDEGLPSASNGTSPAGRARPGGGGRAQVPGWLQLTAGWGGLDGRVPAPPAGAHADQPGEAAQRR